MLVYIFIVTVTTEVGINQSITTKIVRKIPSIAILENEDMRKNYTELTKLIFFLYTLLLFVYNLGTIHHHEIEKYKK